MNLYVSTETFALQDMTYLSQDCQWHWTGSAVTYVQPSQTLAWYHKLRLGSETTVLLSLVHGFGTVYQQPYAVPTPNSENSIDR